jgi:membrane-bound lytic murein transglycosylase D
LLGAAVVALVSARGADLRAQTTAPAAQPGALTPIVASTALVMPPPIEDLETLSATFGTTVPLLAPVQPVAGSPASDIPVPLNPRVLSYIQLFQGRLHDFIEAGMKRGSKYLPMIQDVFRAEGLPLDLAYVPLVESAFKPTALSRAKAKGVWQFMSGTALENGLRRDWYIDERSDPEKATIAAAKYLGTLGKMFDGDWHMALASYNAGPGRLQRAARTAKANDFWKLAKSPRLLPRETREYVPMILAAIVIARNPYDYGFDFEPEAAPVYETVTLPRPVDLRRIAEWSDTPIDEIQALNPELRRWTTPVKDTKYELRVPAGTAARVNARIVESAPADLASLTFYTVKRGDTLAGIAKKLHVAKIDLAEANYLRSTARVVAGDTLMVPREVTAVIARVERPAPAKARSTVAASGQPAPPESRGNLVKVSYQIKRGDTLVSIAQRFKTTVGSIKGWNPDISGDRVRAGGHLTVYAPSDSRSPAN